MQSCSRPCVIRSDKVESPEEHYLRLVQLYIPWIDENKVKQDNLSYEDRS